MFAPKFPRIAWKATALCGVGLASLCWSAPTGPALPERERTTSSAEVADSDLQARACWAEQASIDAEIEAERTTCQQALDEFEACRASRAQWTSVELLSCSLDMTTSLANGNVSDPATLNDCGDPATSSSPAKARRADCPVPACEAHLNSLEAQVLARHGLSARPSC